MVSKSCVRCRDILVRYAALILIRSYPATFHNDFTFSSVEYSLWSIGLNGQIFFNGAIPVRFLGTRREGPSAEPIRTWVTCFGRFFLPHLFLPFNRSLFIYIYIRFFPLEVSFLSPRLVRVTYFFLSQFWGGISEFVRLHTSSTCSKNFLLGNFCYITGSKGKK